MKLNMGRADRSIRLFVIAPVLVVAGIILGPLGALSLIFYALAAVMAATSAVGTCPLYLPFGIRTLGRAGRSPSAPTAAGESRR
ncbi:DUF2892 domain-containing protein [Nocardioides sp. NPDC057767]|jgi:hypothetical protein|uniref:DUF2892 family protein n=1 Tax=Nocardioides albertanoniae TaxID=1175486 RepID=A0A543ACX4_9ACTN|nr:MULTISPECIES: DUF2892 domain-containing protein [Nocardioides]EGD41057.1 hypothetical membrane protein [Nocardioidaceae bacterium Broad-1]MBC7277349.1 DUF2892 domain-containing protein [Nocardioides sp.]TQL70427.1 DUF2892 family protein [Nocardioides albertanoniae]